MSTSLIYRSAAAYEFVMWGLYGRHYPARYQSISELIPDGAAVLELCCGAGHLYQRYLRHKGVRYHGLDINRKFIERLIRLGATGEVANVQSLGNLPPADFVIMQASLYHFLPDPGPVVDAMLRAARKHVIVAEPVRNLSTANIPLLSRLARRHTDPGSGQHQNRFTEATLDAFFSRYSTQIQKSFLIPGGREKVYVLEPLTPAQST